MAGKLQDLTKQAGVIGAFFLSEQGKIIFNELPEEYRKIDFGQIVLKVNRLFKSAQLPSDRLTMFDFSFTEGRIILRKDGPMLLGALCKPQVNFSLMRLSFNVLLNNFKKDKSILKLMR